MRRVYRALCEGIELVQDVVSVMAAYCDLRRVYLALCEGILYIKVLNIIAARCNHEVYLLHVK